MDQVRRSKEAVPTQALLVMQGIMIGLLGSIACLLARLGVGMASVLLSQPQSLTSLGADGLNILIAGSMSVPLLLLVGIGGVRVIKHARLHGELKAHGVTTQGRVVDRWNTWFSLRRPHRFWRYIAYEYANGYAVKQPIPIGIYRHTKIGTPVTVRYLPRDPSISHVELVDDKWRVP